MRAVKLLTVLALILGLALGLPTLSQAQTDTDDSEVTINNQAVFVVFSTPYTTPVTVTNTDIENGATSAGTATVNVDASSVYTVSATSNFGTTAAPGTATFAVGKTAATACQLNLNAAGFVDGDPGPSLGSQAATTGTSGTDHTIGLQVDWTQYTDAPNGAYICNVQVTVTD